MSIRVLGTKELLAKLQQISDAPQKCSKKALTKAGTHMRKVQVEEAKKEHNKYSEHVGYNEIKKYGVKTKGSRQYIDIGLRAKMSAKKKMEEDKRKKEALAKGDKKARVTHWDKVKGLYFNHYGFFHNLTGEYVAGSGWMDNAYDKGSFEAYKIIADVLRSEMGL